MVHQFQGYRRESKRESKQEFHCGKERHWGEVPHPLIIALVFLGIASGPIVWNMDRTICRYDASPFELMFCSQEIFSDLLNAMAEGMENVNFIHAEDKQNEQKRLARAQELKEWSRKPSDLQFSRPIKYNNP